MPVSRAHGRTTTTSTAATSGKTAAKPEHDGVAARAALDAAGNGRLTGDSRAAVQKEVVALYEGGATVRAIAEDVGRSYGFVHGLLKSSGTDMRARGGSRPRS